MADDFTNNLIRLLASEMHFQSVLLASREMFGKSYYALGVHEKAVLEQSVVAQIGGNYTAITPAFLAGQQAPQSMGFPVQDAMPTMGSPTKPNPQRLN